MGGDGVHEASSRRRWPGLCVWMLGCGLLSAGVLMASCGTAQEGIVNLAGVLGVRVTPRSYLGVLPVFHQAGFRPSFRSAGQHSLQGRQSQPLLTNWLNTKPLYGVNAVARAIGTGEGEVEVVTSEEQFDNILATYPGLVVLDVYTTWCGPCKIFAPKFESIAAEVAGKAKFLKMNVDDNESTDKVAKTRLKTKSVPTFYFYVGGELKAEMKGVAEDTFRANMNNYI